MYFTDHYDGYAELIPPEQLVQTKAETHGIESNNSQQRHWFVVLGGVLVSFPVLSKWSI